MKNKFITLCLAMLAIASITVVSCKKESHSSDSRPSEKSVQKDDNMDERLTAFRNKLLSTEKGGETLSLEDANRNLCDLLNFDFGDANNPTDEFRYDTIYVKLAHDKGTVNLSQLAVTYKEAVNQILTSYRMLELQDKSVYSIVSGYDLFSDDVNDELTISIVVTYRGCSRYAPHSVDTLDWHPRRYSSSCDGQVIQKGAPEIMEQWLRTTWIIPACVNGGRVYFTDGLNPLRIKGYETYDSNAGCYLVFAMYTNQIDTVCVSHEEMEFYYENIVDCWDQNVPHNHVLTDVNINSPVEHCPSSLYPGNLWYWDINIQNARPHCTEVEPIH